MQNFKSVFQIAVTSLKISNEQRKKDDCIDYDLYLCCYIKKVGN